MAAIMIVDDEAEIITLLRFMFEKEGHSVTDAANGEMALERLGLEPADPSRALPDLLILDIMMPVMDGYTLNTRLQASERTKAIPIIVLTAKGERMRDLFEMAPNVAAYVRKPFEPKVLRDLVSSILSKKRS